MNLMKKGFLFRHCCTIKVKKNTSSLSFGFKRKEIDQDWGHTPRRGKDPQERMTTSVEDSMAQKFLKTLDEHGEALLTRLKEVKLKKSSHVEINDDEEKVEEWDKKDKAEYERNKQFEKLTTETIAMREKIETM